MTRLNPKKITLAAAGIILAAVFYFMFSAWTFPDETWPMEKGEKIKLDEAVTWKFEADKNGLDQIAVLFGGSKVKGTEKISLDIFDDSCANLIRQTSVDVDSLDADNSQNFKFKRIPDSSEKTYCLKMDYSKSNGSKKAAVFLIDNPLAANKYLNLNGQEFQGRSIAFRPAYINGNIFKNISELNQRVSQYKPWFLKHYFLYFIGFGFIILSLVLAVLLIAV
jgi:hypothetical protein